ncbi:membrane protein insertase YidC [Bacteroidota bacterium]
MEKQTTLAFILIGIILVVWLYMNAPDPQTFPPQETDSTLVDKELTKPADRPLQDQIKQSDSEEPAGQGEFQKPFSDIPERIITVENDLAKIELTSKGGRIRKYYLKEYQTWYYRDLPDDADFYKKHVQLVNQKDGGDFNIIYVTNEGQLVNTAYLDFETDAYNYYYRVEGDDSLSIAYTYTDENNRSITKNFIFYGDDYESKVDIELVNMNEVISSYRYDVAWTQGINFVEENSVDEARYSNALAYASEETFDIDASSVDEEETRDMNGMIDWIGIKNKYFAVIIAPEKPNNDGGAYFEGTKVMHPQYGEREYYSASLKVPFKDLNYQKDTFRLFIGPIDYDLLKSYDKDYQAIYDFGSFMGLRIFRPISEFILLPLLKFLNMFIPNWGFVIIIFSIIIKIVLYPLTKQSYKSMKKMQLLQPKIKELKEKYKDDQQKVQKETMKLYSTYGINPAGGCLPMLLQMPILVALWTLFNVAIEIRHQPFIFWITNLSSPDVLIHLPFTIPILGMNTITGLAPLLGISMFLQQKMSMKDPSQKAMVYMMPIMFTALFMSFPSGLNLYYLMFNLFSVIQQQYINKKKGDDELVPVKNPKKKGGGFMARIMAAAEEQKKAQQQGGKKKKF